MAREASQATLDHALGPLGLDEVLAEVGEGNTASLRLMRLGASEGGVRPGSLGPQRLFPLPHKANSDYATGLRTATRHTRTS